MGKHATFLAAVHMIIRDDEGRILFQRRQGTKLYNGWLGLPAGHVDEGEHPHEAAIREAREELGIELSMEGCVQELHSTRRYPDGRVYFDAYYDFAQNYSGRPTITEAGKCRELVWERQGMLSEDVIIYQQNALAVMSGSAGFFSQDLPVCEDEEVPSKLRG